MIKLTEKIEAELKLAVQRNEAKANELKDKALLSDYSPENGIWTAALQTALNEHEIVIIPSSEAPYLLDGTVVIPSSRHIIAEDGAIIRLTENTKTLMLRNRNTLDGSYYPIEGKIRDEGITIEGGIWEESCTKRQGYGRSGMYDEERSFYGVSTCMLFNNIDHITLKNMTFRCCGGFAVQIGEASDIVCEGIRFEKCFADGLHINGNVENVYIKDVKGEVGDDLVAFNMYDWRNSSVNFGPCRNVICDDLELSESSGYKALRIEPGIYTFCDGREVDCSLTNAVFRHIRGIKTFKLYCQTPAFLKGTSPEKAAVGSGDNIVFEDVIIDLDGPIDPIGGYIESDPKTGSFAGFELGANIKNLYLKNICIKLYREKYPYSYLVCVGPKSVRIGDREVFDPYLSSAVENLYLESITVNGTATKELSPFIKEIVFDSLYPDMPSTASGKIENIIINQT